MNKPFSFLKKFLALECAALLALLCGCDKNVRRAYKNGSETAAAPLKICCNPYYELAFQRVIRSISSDYPDLTVTFTDDKSEADILITDRMDDKTAENFASLDGLSDQADFIPELLFRREKNIIGLPLFLETNGIWLDSLPYLRENADIPYRFEQTVASEFIKKNPMIYSEKSDSLYWGVIAPLYISYGGTAEELGNGELSQSALLPAAERLGEMNKNGIIEKCDSPSEAFAAGKTSGWLCSYLDIVKIQQDMPLSSSLSFSPGLCAEEKESVKLIIRADTLFVSEKADEKTAELFVTQLLKDDNILRLITDTHLPSAVKVNCKDHSLPEIFHEFYSVLSSTSVSTVYVTDSRSDSEVSALNDLTDEALKH